MARKPAKKAEPRKTKKKRKTAAPKVTKPVKRPGQNKVKPRTKSIGKLDTKKLQRMLDTYLSTNSISEVSRIHKVSRTSCYKYRESKKWDQVDQTVKQKTLDALVQIHVDATVSDLDMLTALQCKVYSTLLGGDTMEAKATDAVAITRLKAEILGKLPIQPPTGEAILVDAIARLENPDDIQRILDNCQAAIDAPVVIARDRLESL